MAHTLLLFATGFGACLGFAMLAFSQKAHWLLLRRADCAPCWLRPCGAAFIALAALPAVLRDGVAFGLLVSIIMLGVSASFVVVSLTSLRNLDRSHHNR